MFRERLLCLKYPGYGDGVSGVSEGVKVIVDVLVWVGMGGVLVKVSVGVAVGRAVSVLVGD
jgi:hypothetical protein